MNPEQPTQTALKRIRSKPMSLALSTAPLCQHDWLTLSVQTSRPPSHLDLLIQTGQPFKHLSGDPFFDPPQCHKVRLVEQFCRLCGQESTLITKL